MIRIRRQGDGDESCTGERIRHRRRLGGGVLTGRHVVAVMLSVVQRNLCLVRDVLMQRSMFVRSEPTEQDMECGEDREHHEQRTSRAAVPMSTDDHRNSLVHRLYMLYRLKVINLCM